MYRARASRAHENPNLTGPAGVLVTADLRAITAHRFLLLFQAYLG